MTIPNRTVSIKNVFASTASTTIPTPPAPGISYRNTGTTAAEIGEGWPFKEVVDSAKFNQAMYEYTTICQQVEKYGFLPWSANTDYPAQGCALGSDGKIYQAKQATGPSSTSKDPTTDTSHTYWDLFYYADVTANRALVSNANGKMAASSVTATELGYLSGVTSSIQTQINNRAANNAVVHLTGDELIGGIKTLYSQDIINLRLKSSYIDDDYTPSTSQYSNFIDNVDINNKLLTRIFTEKSPNGANGIALQAWKGSTNYTLSVFTDGTTKAPASDASNSIVTTEAMLKANDDTMYNYVKLGNGLLIQWGHIQQNSQQLNLTFPIPFKNTVYRMFTQDAGQLGGYSYAGVTGITRTTTGATLYSYYANRYYDWLAIGFWY